MKILLDHNLDWRLRRYLVGYEVSAADEMGWGAIGNGEILRLAETEGFDVLLTGDANLNYQQNISGRSISIIVLRALNNRRKTHIPMMTEVLDVLQTIGKSQVLEILHEDLKKARNRPENP